MSILVTGAAGFIGFHVSRALLARGEQVVGVDSLNDYYDVGLKQARLAQLQQQAGFSFHKINIADREAMHSLSELAGVTGIIHLAAQAGVRYSLENPYAYVEANVMGQVVMLELARQLLALKHFVYASSSSVYGGNSKLPFSVEDAVEKPMSLYAATKRTDELFGYTYAHLFRIPMTGLRFFTVYGPWGRPDMAAFLFTKAISEGQPIKLFNGGKMRRDFTYIDDIVAGILAVLERPPQDGGAEAPPHRVYNLGNNNTEELGAFVRIIEQALSKQAVVEMLPMQPGDVEATYADISASQRDFGFSPCTSIEVGLPRFVAWYQEYHAQALAVA